VLAGRLQDMRQCGIESWHVLAVSLMLSALSRLFQLLRLRNACLGILPFQCEKGKMGEQLRRGCREAENTAQLV